MAYVHRDRQHAIGEAILRNGTRFVVVTAYATSVAVAVMLLAPVVFGDGSSETPNIPPGPTPETYTVQPGDTPASVAAAHGLSLARLYALNPGLTLFGASGERLVVGLR
jgi:LysM repeat protein